MDYDDLYFEKFDRQEMDMIYQALKVLKEKRTAEQTWDKKQVLIYRSIICKLNNMVD